MTPGQIGAGQIHQIGLLQIFISARHRSLPGTPGRPRRDAMQSRELVSIFAEPIKPFHQLVGDHNIPRQNFDRHIKPPHCLAHTRQWFSGIDPATRSSAVSQSEICHQSPAAATDHQPNASRQEQTLSEHKRPKLQRMIQVTFNRTPTPSGFGRGDKPPDTAIGRFVFRRFGKSGPCHHVTRGPA